MAVSPAGAQIESRTVVPYGALRLTLENADANLFVFDNGYGVVGAAGVRYRDNWRGELSISRRGSDIIQVGPVSTDGFFRAWAWLVNVYYHPFGVDRPVSPYVGLGGGFNHATVEAISNEADPVRVGLGFPTQRYVQKSWQGKIGIALRIQEGLYLDTAAAYFVSDDQTIKTTFRNNPTVESAYRTYSALIGVRMEF